MSFGTKSAGDDGTSAWANLIEAALGGGFPAQGAHYIVFYNTTDSEFNVRNGLDGTIDATGSNAATVIQAALDACTANANETVFLLGDPSNTFAIGATQLDATGVNLIGSGNSAKLTYTGTSYAIKYDGSTTQQLYSKVGNFRIALTNNDGKAIQLYERCHYFDLFRIFVDGPSHANSIGFEIDGGDNGCYFNNLYSLRTMNCGTGIKLTTTGTQGANANNLISCILREPFSRGIDIDTAEGTIILGGRVEGTEDNIDGLYINDDNVHLNGMSFEVTGAGANAIETTAAATAGIHLAPGYITSTGAQLVDGGSGILINHPNFVNSGTSTGTGAQQTIAHGLAITPTRVLFANIEDGANAYQSAAADATNIYVTAVNTLDYVWKAWYES